MAARILAASEAAIGEAARRLRAGGLVAFPTETVYGLGANALDAEATGAIFTTKGRPATNPLIVHVADIAAARALSRAWSDAAEVLARAFWPGPLTLVVAKTEGVPDVVTAGGATVAVRVPDHPVALALLRAFGGPVAAPSANRSEEVSPTTALHVLQSLGPYADDLLILDGGASRVGLESTVLDVTGETPRLLRPGMVTRAQLAAVVATVIRGETAGAGDGGDANDEIARSPGQQSRHYAPRTPVALLHVGRDSPYGFLQPGDVWLTQERDETVGPLNGVHVIRLPAEPNAYAARLYAALREADALNAERIVVEMPGSDPEWAAIRDRLLRAASQG